MVLCDTTEPSIKVHYFVVVNPTRAPYQPMAPPPTDARLGNLLFDPSSPPPPASSRRACSSTLGKEAIVNCKPNSVVGGWPAQWVGATSLAGDGLKPASCHGSICLVSKVHHPPSVEVATYTWKVEMVACLRVCGQRAREDVSKCVSRQHALDVELGGHICGECGLQQRVRRDDPGVECAQQQLGLRVVQRLSTYLFPDVVAVVAAAAVPAHGHALLVR